MNGSDGESWRKRIWDLYQHACAEEQFFLTDFHRRVAFFGGLASVLIGATIGGGIQASLGVHYVLLALGQILIFAFSRLAITAVSRPYQRFLEAITMKAKLEHEMRMTEPRRQAGNWVEREPLVVERHLDDRLYTKPSNTRSDPDLKSSRHFVEYRLQHGSQAVFNHFFKFLQVLSIALCGLLVYLAWITPWNSP